MNEQFTPGPWNLLTNKPNSGMLIGAERGDIICGVWNFSEANAHLIETAPLMYAALKMVSQSAFFNELPALTQNTVLDALSKANPK